MKTQPERIYNVSNTQLSIARYYGGITFNGASYTYDNENDMLIRDDLLKKEEKDKKSVKKQETQRLKNKPLISDLFF